jgi:hypothetical protein
VADSYVSDSSLTTNFGLSTTLRTDLSPIQRSYLRFDVPALSGSVLSAKVQIYATSGNNTGYTLSNTAGGWGETSINYSNAPAVGSALGNSGPITANAWTQVDVSSLVTGSGQYNVVMSTTSNTATTFVSNNEVVANQPQLLVRVSGSAPASTATKTPTATATFTATLTPTLTPTPTATAACGSTVTVQASADSYVNDASPSTNYGSSTSLRTDASPIQLNVPALSGSIASATLRVFANTAETTGYSVFSTSNQWSETTLNFSNAQHWLRRAAVRDVSLPAHGRKQM